MQRVVGQFQSRRQHPPRHGGNKTLATPFTIIGELKAVIAQPTQTSRMVPAQPQPHLGYRLVKQLYPMFVT